jgi:hypothetical protein
VQFLSFKLREYLTALFNAKNFTSLIKDFRCIQVRILRFNFVTATGIVQGVIVLEPSSCKGDTLPALPVWFHHNLAGFSNSNNDFCCFLSVITRYYDGPYTLLETG